MYRSCIFCSADLKANDALERFPVGRSIAFDEEKGRLWAVCPKCARWNLAPIEERWEAIEDAERIFRDTRTRVHSGNVGLAKLPDGTRIIRIGTALAGELAAWRYGESLVRRRRRSLLAATIPAAAVITVSTAGAVALAAGAGALYAGSLAFTAAIRQYRGHKLVYAGPAIGAGPDAMPVRVRRRDLAWARLGLGDDGVELHLPVGGWTRAGMRLTEGDAEALVLRGPEARMALGRTMAAVNSVGASCKTLEAALDVIHTPVHPGSCSGAPHASACTWTAPGKGPRWAARSGR